VLGEAEAHAQRVGLQLPYAAVLVAMSTAVTWVSRTREHAGALFDPYAVPGEGEQIAGRLREPGGLRSAPPITLGRGR